MSILDRFRLDGRRLFITGGSRGLGRQMALALADKGYRQAMQDDPHLRNGLNVHCGNITFEAVAETLGYDYVPAEQALAG